MSGKLSKNIVLTVRTQFEEKCVQLLFDSHMELLKKGTNLKEEDENAITVQLIGLMKKNPVSYDYKIDIGREHYLDSEDTYAGIADPNKSPRIDIRLMTWTGPEQFEYFFEAKNLYENDFTKAGNKIPVNSKSYQQRYIDTGIQNFINGRYSHGCLVGYVLEGDADKIADKINALLKSAGRNTERLSKTTAVGKIQYHYESTHTGKILRLTHYFLSFT